MKKKIKRFLLKSGKVVGVCVGIVGGSLVVFSAGNMDFDVEMHIVRDESVYINPAVLGIVLVFISSVFYRWCNLVLHNQFYGWVLWKLINFIDWLLDLVEPRSKRESKDFVEFLEELNQSLVDRYNSEEV